MSALELTVSQLNEYVRRSLASDPMLRGITLTGELSNFKRHVSGHWYFTLKDEGASIACAMFRQNAASVRFAPADGQRVRLTGSVGLYVRSGSYQFYAERMERDGTGELYLRFEALKRRLHAEGLFDASLKKPLPLLPCGVGIVTSGAGAVMHDIARVAWRRFPGMPLYLCPVKVQGEGAAEEIAGGLRLLDALPQAQVIIVGRGGGSLEDLWAFNEEAVARAIAACQTPVISAVGHETDVTIADFVADVRAATPSAAAELAVPDRGRLVADLASGSTRLVLAAQRMLQTKRQALQVLQARIAAQAPEGLSERLRLRMEALQTRLNAAFAADLSKRRQRLEAAAIRLRSSGPEQTLSRGYAIALREGKPVRDASTLAPGDGLTLVFASGGAQATVSQVVKEEEAWQPEP